MLYPRLVLMHRLLAPEGMLYLPLDWHAAPYALNPGIISKIFL